MALSKDRIGGLLMLTFCLIYAWQSQNIKLLPFQLNSSFHARTMPEVLAVLGVGLSVLVIAFPSDKERFTLTGQKLGLGLAFLALMSAYGLAVRPAGFLLSTSLFLTIGFAMLGERSIAKLLLVAVPLVVSFWVLMNYGLSVFIEPLPAFLRG
ncbi:tripartite tricarboxylate transporter TctB family protein [Ahrensia sp. R2A130]|uniref:tripartite tricarboxylate transporter TctB family protein n=1 Tax=Ahrensia sp. R2A130 TaxID=744979 RepID=UPI0001E0D0EA|nr:tripartite tricarboxylate transporter TctB family protein [Ahrensia sp. R2A130]EFL89267.1 tricarboxylic transport TctB [Ahrensia sp. R2A130]